MDERAFHALRAQVELNGILLGAIIDTLHAGTPLQTNLYHQAQHLIANLQAMTTPDDLLDQTKNSLKRWFVRTGLDPDLLG